MCFPQTAETPICIPGRLIRPLPPENLYQNPEAKEAKEVMKKIKKLDLSSPQAAAPPELSSTTG